MANIPIELIIPVVVVFGYFGIFALVSNEIENRNMRKMERSAAWPQVQGVVKETIAKGMSVRVTYEYLAEGRVYLDIHKIAFPQAMVVRWVATARALGDRVRKEVANFPPGQHVILRYNPQNPGESVLYCRGDLTKADPSNKEGVSPQFALLK